MPNSPPLSPLATLRWAVVAPLLAGFRPARVLEIGCGLGGFGARIAEQAAYVGVEHDETSYKVARSRIEFAGGIVHNGGLDSIDPEQRFDLVCAFEVLEHLADDAGQLTTWMERLSPGGIVLVSVPAWPERYGAFDELVGHYRRYTPDQLESLLRKVGCEEVRSTIYGWPLGMATERVRNIIARGRGRGTATSMSARTANSGRLMQPRSKAAGWAMQVGTAPFVAAQKLRPSLGIGLVGVGRRHPK